MLIPWYSKGKSLMNPATTKANRRLLILLCDTASYLLGVFHLGCACL